MQCILLCCLHKTKNTILTTIPKFHTIRTISKSNNNITERDRVRPNSFSMKSTDICVICNFITFILL